MLTLKRTDLAKFGVRGICLAEFPLPAIVFTKESPSAQAFTLVHEFAHVLLKASGIFGELERNAQAVERWCNRFAGAFLMPTGYMEALPGPRPLRPAAAIADDDLEAFCANPERQPARDADPAGGPRLCSTGLLLDRQATRVRPGRAGVPGRGRSEYYGSRYRNTQGDLYTGLVLEAWGMDRITNHNAAEFMGIRNIAHLEAIRDHFGDA